MSNSPPNVELTPQAAQDVLAACRAGALRAGWALSRALGIAARLVVHESTMLASSSGSPWAERSICEGPGLVVLMPVSGGAALLLLSGTQGVLPAWVAQPNGLQRGRLAAVAQELGTSLLPRRVSPRDCAAAGVSNLAASLARGRCSADAACIRMSLALADGRTAPALLAWPLLRPEDLFEPARARELKGHCSTQRQSAQARCSR